MSRFHNDGDSPADMVHNANCVICLLRGLITHQDDRDLQIEGGNRNYGLCLILDGINNTLEEAAQQLFDA